jgi:PAS domain S-box-containing protein
MMLTGYSDAQAMMDAINECGVFRYLSKPWKKEDMAHALQQAVERHALQQENERLLTALQQVNASLEARVQEQVAAIEQQRQDLEVLNAHLQRSNVALQASERRYRSIAENFPNGFVFLATPDLAYDYIDGQELRRLGLDAKQLAGRKIHDVHDLYTASKMAYYLRQALQGLADDFEVVLWEQDYAISCLSLDGAVLAVAQNITQKKRAQEAVAHRSDFLSKVFNTVPCLLYLFEVQTFQVSYINRRITQVLGYSPEDFQGRSRAQWQELVHPDDLPNALRHFKSFKRLKEQEVAIAEYRMRHKNGHYVWLRASSAVFERSHQGQVSKVLSYLEDISKAKLAEAQLGEHKAFLEQISNLSPNMVYIFDLRTQSLIYANKLTSKVLGFSWEELKRLGNALLPAVVHADDLEGLRGHYRELAMQQASSDEGSSILYRLKDWQGNWRWMHDTHVVFRRDEHGLPLQVLGMAKDVTELKEAELALKQSEERLIETQRLARLGRWEMQADTRRIRWFNGGGSFAALPPGDYSDFSTYLTLMPQQDAEQLVALQERLLQHGTPYELDVQYRLQDGRTAFLHIKARPQHDRQGNISHIIGSAMDVTRLKAYELQLKRLNESKDRILATVAHDLRSPINQIQGLANILRIQLGNSQGLEQDIFLRIQESCRRGLTLISELLEIAELESEHYALQAEPMLLDALIGQVLEPFYPQMAKAQLQLLADFQCPGAWVSVQADKFSRVLENLLGNAQKFTEEGGQIRVGTQRRPHSAVVCISDTGIGIPDVLQPRIFERFSKAGRTGLKGEKSTGLGMSIVKQVVELHQGLIWFDSQEGKGTSFFIELPLHSPPETATRPEA